MLLVGIRDRLLGSPVRSKTGMVRVYLVDAAAGSDYRVPCLEADDSTRVSAEIIQSRELLQILQISEGEGLVDVIDDDIVGAGALLVGGVDR